jgi:hypothetical protein
MKLLSRSPPSVTMPVAPRASARAAKMSPIVPAPGSSRASITSTSSGPIDSTARRCAFNSAVSASRTSSRSGT